MRLRTQLVLVSLLALLLPWAGISLIYEIEQLLRVGQQTALGAVAESVSSLLEVRGDLPAQRGGDTGDVYFYTVARLPTVDGYPDADDEFATRLSRYTAVTPSGKRRVAEFVGMTDTRDAYIFIRTNDTSIRYRSPADRRITAGDHVLIAVDGGRGPQRYWLAPEAPGAFVARYRVNGKLQDEPRIRAVWRDIDGGYQLELRMPMSLIGTRFGFAVVDAAPAGSRVGSFASGTPPGHLIRSDTALKRMLEPFAHENLRLTLVDSHGWVIARTGSLEPQSDHGDALPPGVWIIEMLYQRLMADAPQDGQASADGTPRLARREVMAAQAGQTSGGWYDLAAAPGVAMVSVASPVVRDGQVAGVLVAEESTRRILSLANGAVIRMMSLTAVATLLISAGLVVFAAILSMRIRRLGRAVDAALGDDGRINADFPQRWGDDELGDLGRHFGRLLGRMREYNDYLRTLAAKLSHELRTPLAVVSSSLDNLDHEPLGAGGQRYVERARSGTARLSRILVSMSEASRVEQSIAAAEFERVDIAALIDGNVQGYRAAFGRTITCVLPGAPVYLEGSTDLLSQMLDKLVDNAVEFAAPGGSITVQLEQTDSHAVLTVDNDGPPLPAAMRGELFESMVSIRPEQHARAHLGLGLAIVRLVVELHRGAVRAEDRPGGVRMHIELPR